MKHLPLSSWLLLVAALSPIATYASDCVNENSAIPFTTPTSDFILNENGTATHLKTGLVWDRNLVLGGQWAANNLYLIKVKNSELYKGFDDWRMPNINELESIFEYRCWSPAINTTVFPDVLSTEYDHLISSTVWQYDVEKAWAIGLDDGRVQERAKHLNSSTIMVRGGRLFDSFDAQFPQWLLTVNKVGSGNGMVSNVGQDMCNLDSNGQCLVDPGSTIKLSAVAADGSVFLGWTSASGAVPGSCDGTVAICNVIDVSANGSVNAIFVPLDVFKNGFEADGAD